MRIKDFVKCNLNNLFYREYRLRRKVRRHLLPYYKEAFPVGKNTNKMIVFMADGRKQIKALPSLPAMSRSIAGCFHKEI